VRYPEVIQEAADECSPALVANYTYELVKQYNQFYQQVPIFGTTNEHDKAFRIGLSNFVGKVIASSMNLLGIDVPERM
jgi:arginyl-tRNA synthetase